MQRNFWKMHGLGNDFVIVDGRTEEFTPSAEICRALADRHTGIGFDQLIVLSAPRQPMADIFMSIYNADGSESGACGNATRCVARILFEDMKRNEAVIETVAGLLPVSLLSSGLIAVDLAAPSFEWDEIPLARKMDTKEMDFSCGQLVKPSTVNVGNPHAVFFVSDIEKIPLAELGPQIERDPLFPERVNVEIAQVMAPDRIRMRVWERGVGITAACGSGACAVLIAAARRGLSGRKAETQLDGGSLWVEWRADNRVILTGSASLCYTGTLAMEMLADQLQKVAA